MSQNRPLISKTTDPTVTLTKTLRAVLYRCVFIFVQKGTARMCVILSLKSPCHPVTWGHDVTALCVDRSHLYALRWQKWHSTLFSFGGDGPRTERHRDLWQQYANQEESLSSEVKHSDRTSTFHQHREISSCKRLLSCSVNQGQFIPHILPEVENGGGFGLIEWYSISWEL